MSASEGLLTPGGIVRKAGRWLTVIGIVFIVLGVLAIVEPAVAGLAVAILVGWVLIFAGAAHAVDAFGGGGPGRVVWQVVLAALYIIGGWYFLTHPLLGLGTLTLVLAAILLAEAVVEIVAYFTMRGEWNSGWRLVNAIVTLLLGGLIWIHWPSSSVWAIGTLVGVNLLITGISRLMLGTAARKLAPA
ncbi:MAG TPA: DUF308 domain-containing protein [Vicinamibacterales bacterium]|jgi:uncharacterized membrane protein HdeD (DUF308 family)